MKNSFDIAVRLLARREHSQQELRQKLRRNGFNTEDISKTISRLIELDLQSDLRFAQSMAHYKLTNGYGARYVRGFLSQKGVKEEIIEESLDHNFADKAVTCIIALLRKRKDNLNDMNEKAKCFRYLTRRGFAFDDIHAAIAYLQQEDQEHRER